MKPEELLEHWLETRLSDDQLGWLRDRIKLIRSSKADRDVHVTLGFIPRKLPRDDLALNPDELADANETRAGWDPSEWTIDGAARTLVLCHRAELDPATFGDLFVDLCRTADLSETLMLYRSICLYPDSELLDTQVGNGLRTNMRAVFDAIAHRNPYPKEHFSENRWNHMVLKALFIDSTLSPIQGLDERGNVSLATTLSDYAHERWAAGRPVTPELWRCVGPWASGSMLQDLRKVLNTGSRTEQQAAVLSLLNNELNNEAAEVAELLAITPDITAAARSGSLTWANIDEAID